MHVKVWPYKQGSRSARALSDALRTSLPRHRVRVLLPPGRSRWAAKAGDQLINWGNSAVRDGYNGAYLNHPLDVSRASNKLNFLASSHQHTTESLIPWTSHYNRALLWVQTGNKVVCRTKLNGHSGDGIVIATTEEELVTAPLYTLYVPKNGEWRFHFFKQRDGIRWFTQQKKRNRDRDDSTIRWDIRNVDNGFIYTVHDVEHFPSTDPLWGNMEVYTKDLRFGAFDVIRGNSKANLGSSGDFRAKKLVLECNTAPGIESPTLLSWYNSQFTEYFNEA